MNLNSDDRSAIRDIFKEELTKFFTTSEESSGDERRNPSPSEVFHLLDQQVLRLERTVDRCYARDAGGSRLGSPGPICKYEPPTEAKH